ncbi:MAG: hypothetical protein EA402_14305 [Planctomycetota bacterium]|nr:MAG: hypothetical protein EA402_14305 [Planctomycetota bacterium]
MTHTLLHPGSALVITAPDPDHLLAGAVLAAAIGQDGLRGVDGLEQLPARLRVASPLHEQRTLIQEWLQQDPDQRCPLWVLALDAKSGIGQDAIADLRAAGAEILIGPDAHSDPMKAVRQRLHQGSAAFRHDEAALRPLLDDMKGRKATLLRGLRERIGSTPRNMYYTAAPNILQWLNEQAWALALLPPQLRRLQALSESRIPSDQRLWQRLGAQYAGDDPSWLQSLWASLLLLNRASNTHRWEQAILGPSATAIALRRAMGYAERSIANGHGVILVGHDPGEAQRLAEILAASNDELPAPTAIHPWSAEHLHAPSILLATPEDEAQAYQHAPADWVVVDIPPLLERSLDVPVIAIDMLAQLHTQLQRPGAPRAFSQDPRELAWLAGCWWPGGSDELRAALAERLQSEAHTGWQGPSAHWRPLPAVLHPSANSSGGSFSLTAIKAQTFLWARGAHRSQEEALSCFGRGTSDRPPWACVTLRARRSGSPLWPGPPRRLRHGEQGWYDPWADSV